MDHLILSIIDIEWALFDKVGNIGGRAGCQDDRDTFFLMRSAQLKAWNRPMLDSYLQDLHTARSEGRNPLHEKYGYMMERTDPVNYLLIRDLLPPRSPEKLALIDAITATHRKWLSQLSRRCPNLTGAGRSADPATDSPYTTSFETYLRGELSTYSLSTLTHYLNYARELQLQGRNLNEMILTNTVLQYGYDSLEQAEQALAPN